MIRQFEIKLSITFDRNMIWKSFWCQNVPWILNNMLKLKYQFWCLPQRALLARVGSHICVIKDSGFYFYYRIQISFAHLRPVILSADWSTRRLQDWTCTSLPTVAEFLKLKQSIVTEIQRQSADLYKVQSCSWHFLLVSQINMVNECHPLGII